MFSGRRRQNSFAKQLHALTPVRFALLVIIGLVILALVLAVVQRLWFAANDFGDERYAIDSDAQSESASGRGGTGAGNKSYPQGVPGMSDSAEIGIAPDPQPPMMPEETPGNDAEQYETTDYSVRIETGDLDSACGTIEGLKPMTYVVFEHAERHDHGCYYSFKVENARAGEVLSLIQSLEPENISEQTYTIKATLDFYLDEVEIAERRLAAVEEALTEAEAAYQELAEVAAQSGDAETLRKSIAERVRIIEQMTQARLYAKREFDRVSREMALANDRLEYSFFTVMVSERVYVDWDRIRDSWTSSIHDLAKELNIFIQGLTVTFLTFLLRLLLIGIYIGVIALVLLFVAKHGVRLGKDFWKK